MLWHFDSAKLLLPADMFSNIVNCFDAASFVLENFAHCFSDLSHVTSAANE